MHEQRRLIAHNNKGIARSAHCDAPNHTAACADFRLLEPFAFAQVESILLDSRLQEPRHGGTDERLRQPP
jgi:hypothetical protein